MNGACRLSRRWHQQFCHSPGFGPHQQCCRALVFMRGYRDRPGVHRPKDTAGAVSNISDLHFHLDRPTPPPNRRFPRSNVIVREFEQHGSDGRTRRRILPDAALQDETTEVWSQIQELDKQLAVMKQGPFGPQSKFMQSLPQNEREQLLQALADEGVLPDQDGDEMDLAEIDRLMDEEEDEPQKSRLGVSLRIPRVERAYVQRFNKALRAAEEGNGDVLKNLNLWKWYLRSQQRVPNFSTIVPERVWQFLWQSQSDLVVRPKHMVMLAKDMIGAGQELQNEQCLEYMRSLHAVGDTSTALTVWEKQRSRFMQTTPDILSKFCSTGVQLYSSLGRPSKAQEIFHEGMAHGADPKILVHVISAWANEQSPQSAVKAWAAYVELKMALGSTIATDLYESISNIFLDTGHNEMALAVFKELVSYSRGDGKISSAQKEFVQHIEKKRTPEEIEKSINEMSLATLLVLPKEYQNKYFFASWIKKLIGEKRVDSAAMVVDLMFERDITPDAIHLNGIIGAWFRQNSPESQIKAERLAKDMIQARVRLVQQRVNNRSPRDFGLAFRKVMPLLEPDNTWRKSVHLSRPMCAANVETFAILFDFYEHQMRRHDITELFSVMLELAQLQPNIFIMNKILTASIRERTLAKFWKIYATTKQQLRLNLDTFSLAWHACGLHFAPRAEADKGPSNLYPSSRQMFGEMMQWLDNLRKRDLRQATEDFDSDLYAQIIKCFCYQMDLPGTICAMRGLSQILGVTPDERAIHLITGQIARMLPNPHGETPKGRRPRFNQRLSSSKSLLREVADIVDTLEAKHKLDFVESGKATPDEVESSSSEVTQRIRLEVLTELLIMTMQRTQKVGGDHVKTLHDVAAVMQVDLSTARLEFSPQ